MAISPPVGTDCIGDDECPENGTVVTIGQQGCQRAPPPQMEAVHVKDLLALNPSEYSYFDNQLLSAWAGPGHWRMRPLSKGYYYSCLRYLQPIYCTKFLKFCIYLFIDGFLYFFVIYIIL